MTTSKTILITGGAGFIGSHVIRLFVNRYPEYKIVNLDKLTYAGNLENLRDIEAQPNYIFELGDVLDLSFLTGLFKKYSLDGIIHLAAESHVDRSLEHPVAFAETNIIGTLNLLHAAKQAWTGNWASKKFYQISTDEVYGSAPDGALFTEETPVDPRSPYSSSKAAADHFVLSYHSSFGFPSVVSRCSNNYGPYHFPEKLIPLMINNIINKKPLPVYGQGENVRDWLYVEDHAKAIDTIFHKATPGSVYNIGGNNEWRNIDVVNTLCTLLDRKLKRNPGESAKLITYVKDRPGHDLRYAIDSSKLQHTLGWKPEVDFASGLEKTVDWFLENKDWLDHVTSGAYREYYTHMYQNR